MKSSRIAWVLLVAAFVGLSACQRSVTKGEHGKELALSKPADQTITAGDVNEIRISVDREKFAGPVDIEFDDLPRGISLKETALEIPAGDSARTFTLVAARDATPIEDHRVKVTAEGGDLTVSEFFKITVKAAN